MDKGSSFYIVSCTKYAPNLKGIKLHNCVIVSCNLNGCLDENVQAEQSSTQITNNMDMDIDIPSKDVKTANSKSDITLKVTTAVFDGYLSVMHEQSTSSSLKASGYLYFLLVGIIAIVLTLVIVATCYILYKYCCKKKACRKRKTVAKKTDNDPGFESETLFDQNDNLGLGLNPTAPQPPPGFLRSGNRYKKTS